MRWLALLVLGCSSNAVDVPSRSGGQIELELRPTTAAARLTLLIVDDAQDPAATNLRAAAVSELRKSMHQLVEGRWGGCSSSDPAQDHYSDERVVVAFPSAPKLTLLGPSKIPALAWVTSTSQHDEVETLAQSSHQALGSRPAQSGEPHQPIRTAIDASQLVLGLRSPESDDENLLLASLDPGAYVRVLVASTRDDEGAGSIESMLESWKAIEESGRLSSVTVVGPFGESSVSCNARNSLSSSRLFEWGSTIGTRTLIWPCGVESTWLEEGACDGGPACLRRRISILPSGAAACRVWLDLPGQAGCDPAKGRSDPEGVPTWADDYGETRRRCELRQLEGPALRSCQTSLACEGCPAGWCATEIPALLDGCPAGTFQLPFRSAGGAGS